MSIESLKNSELTSNQIDAVTGGDYGDVSKELSKTKEGVKYLYSVGQYVEVYDNSTHWTTERGQITSVKVGYDLPSTPGKFGKYSALLQYAYYPIYTVQIEKTGELREVISDAIES